jgi:hypothetical protein
MVDSQLRGGTGPILHVCNMFRRLWKESFLRKKERISRKRGRKGGKEGKLLEP